MKRKIAAVVLGSCVVAATLFYFINRPALSGIKYPSPNGYDSVQAAGERMTPLPVDFDSTQDVETLQAYIDQNADALATLDQAMGQEYLVRLPENQSLQETMDQASVVRNAARLLLTQARLLELGGDSSGAADALTQMAILGRRSGRGGLLIHQMVAVAIERRALESLMQLSSKLSPEQRSRIVQTIQAEAAAEPSVDERLDAIEFREREMTKREYGTFAGSFMIWRLGDSELNRDGYRRMRDSLAELELQRKELVKAFGDPATGE